MSLLAEAKKNNLMRRDIQALRGLAVLAVVLYHLDLPLIRGGFLGVDVFFVISGFVITETILRSSGTLKERIVHFYYRRARRILPAATFVGLLTLLAAYVFLPSQYFGKYIIDALSSLLMFSNANFAYQNLDYLNQGLDPSPFLHYWSLAVEEQFYLVWPLILILVVRNRKHTLSLLLPLLFLIALITTYFKPAFSYLSPSSRAWEFLAGALIVFLPKPSVGLRLKRWLIFFAASVVLASMFLITTQSATPGISTALPVFGTASLIYFGFTGTLLNPIVWLGNISYSLYLVHWPLIIFAHAIYGERTIAGGTLIFAASIVVAKLISMLIEAPFRFGNIKIAVRKFALAALIAIGGVLLSAIQTGFLATGESPNFTINTSHPFSYDYGCEVRGAVPKVQGCDFGDTESKKRVVLVGDSHASQFFPGLNLAAKRASYKLTNFTKSGCAPYPLDRSRKRGGAACVEWQKRITLLIEEIRPDILVFSSSTGRLDFPVSHRNTPEEYAKGFDQFVSEVKGSVGKLVYVGDTAYPGEDSIACLKRHHHQPSKCDLKNVKPPLTLRLEAEAKRLEITFIDSRAFLCTTSTCPAILDGKNVYRDKSHLSVGIASLVAKGLAPIFDFKT